MMPRTKLGDAFAPKDPPIDWLLAAVLERMKIKHIGLQRLAELACVSYSSMRQYLMRSPWSWPMDVRERVCKSLGIDISFSPSGLKIEERVK